LIFFLKPTNITALHASRSISHGLQSVERVNDIDSPGSGCGCWQFALRDLEIRRVSNLALQRRGICLTPFPWPSQQAGSAHNNLGFARSIASFS
jgi:hypothetical protein